MGENEAIQIASFDLTGKGGGMGIKRNLRLRKRKGGGREGKGKMVTVCQIKAEYIGHPHSRGETFGHDLR